MTVTFTVGPDANSLDPNISSWLSSNPFSLEFMSSLSSFVPDTSSWMPDQLSTTQLVFKNGTDFVVIQGTGMALNGGLTLGSTTSLGDFLDNVSGTITNLRLVTGGSFNSGNDTVSGTTIGTASFSATQWQVTSPNSDGQTQTVTVTGTDLPTSLSAVTGIFAGTYAGSAIALSGITLTGPSQTETISFSSTALDITIDGYELAIDGSSLPTSLTAAEIDGTAPISFSSTLTGATLTDLGNGQVDAALSGLGAGIAVSVEEGGIVTGFQDVFGAGVIDASAYTGDITEAITDSGDIEINGKYVSDVPVADLIGGSGMNTIDLTDFASGSGATVFLGDGSVSNGIGGTQGLRNFTEVVLDPFSASAGPLLTVGGVATGDILQLDLPPEFVNSVTETPSSFTVTLDPFFDLAPVTYGVTGGYGTLAESADANGNTDLTFKAVNPPTEFAALGRHTTPVAGVQVVVENVGAAESRGLFSQPASQPGGISPPRAPPPPAPSAAATDSQVALLAAAIASVPASISGAAEAAPSAPSTALDSQFLTQPQPG
jgi:hypothetical protein